MLYMTTRSNHDTYTAYRALCENTAPDNGCYVPFKFPVLSELKLKSYIDGSFHDTVADVLNLFFSTGLTSWDIDLCVGKVLPKITSMNHKICVAELWRNPEGKFQYIIERIYKQLCGNRTDSATPTNWAVIAIRIAFLFALYGQTVQNGFLDFGEHLDVVASAENFTAPIAAFYAKRMGLPLDIVICASDDTCNVWDLIHRGTFVPFAHSDVMALGIERLIHCLFGRDMVQAFAQCKTERATFSVSQDDSNKFVEFFCAVAGADRANNTINSLYRSSGYITDPSTAICFSALQDYRASTALSKLTLICAEYSPADYASRIATVTGVDEVQIKNK